MGDNEYRTLTYPAMGPLGLVLSTAVKAPIDSFLELGVLAEEQGFHAVLVNEGRGDALACSEAIAQSTRNIKIGTNIANIYFRHPFLTAQSAATIAELSQGRLILGLGVSHRPLLDDLQINMGDSRQYLRTYAQTINRILAGDRVGTLFPGHKSKYRVPIFLAALTVETATLAGEVADGLMPFLPTRKYLNKLVKASRDAARIAGRDPGAIRCILSIPTFVAEDLKAAYAAARYNLSFFAQLPFYRRQWRRCGYGTTVDLLQKAWRTRDRRAVASLVPDSLVEEVCVLGPPSRCQEQLDSFREAGATLPLLAVSPVDQDRLTATRSALKSLSP